MWSSGKEKEMKYIYLNLKRFDIPPEMGGVNRIAPMDLWAEYIVGRIQETLGQYDSEEAQFTVFFPEAHILAAAEARRSGGPLRLGCQGVYREDTAAWQNFGAFTTQRPAAAMAAAGCEAVLIGHCEERRDKEGILWEAGVEDAQAVNRLLNQEILCAQARGMKTLYCVGEKESERGVWREVLEKQLETGLKGADPLKTSVAYEPVWSIGPGRQPAGYEDIETAAKFIKEKTSGLEVVYGGGLKRENAGMLASVKEIDGGLIALTRFTGKIGFYPEEYLEIIRIYLEAAGTRQLCARGSAQMGAKYEEN